MLSKVVGKICLFYFVVVVVVESSVTVVYPHSDQSFTSGLDDLNSVFNGDLSRSPL